MNTTQALDQLGERIKETKERLDRLRKMAVQPGGLILDNVLRSWSCLHVFDQSYLGGQNR